MKNAFNNVGLLRYYQERQHLQFKVELKNIIQDIMNGDPLLYCTNHPFGFIKVELGETNFKDRLTTIQINIWSAHDRVQQNSQSICHDHNSHLESLIVHGTLINNLFAVKYSDNSSNANMYVVEYKKGTSVSKKHREDVICTFNKSEIYRAWDNYEIFPHEFHSSYVPMGSLTYTLLLRYNFKSEPTYNIRFKGGDPEYTFDRILVDRNRLFSILQEVNNSL